MKLLAHQIKDSLTELLNNNSNNLFSVTGFRKVNFDEQNVITPLVSVLVSKGQFPTAGKGTINVFPHECIIKIQIIASDKYGINLDIINNPNATSQQIQEAIAAGTLAAANVESKILDTIGLLFNIISNVNNRNLGYGINAIDQKNLEDYEIKSMIENGSHITLKAEMTLKIKVTEMVTSAVPVTADNPGLFGNVQGHADSGQKDFGNAFVNT